MDNDVLVGVNKAQYVIARNRVTTFFKNVCANVVIGDNDRFLLVEPFADNNFFVLYLFYL